MYLKVSGGNEPLKEIKAGREQTNKMGSDLTLGDPVAPFPSL